MEAFTNIIFRYLCNLTSTPGDVVCKHFQYKCEISSYQLVYLVTVTWTIVPLSDQLSMSNERISTYY